MAEFNRMPHVERNAEAPEVSHEEVVGFLHKAFGWQKSVGAALPESATHTSSSEYFLDSPKSPIFTSFSRGNTIIFVCFKSLWVKIDLFTTCSV